jgi:Fe-S-cluster containining protein
VTWRPTLRDGVRVDKTETGHILVDTVFDRRLAIEGERGDAARLLDGTRSLEDYVRDGGADADALLRRLMLLNMIDGAGREIVERYARVARGDEPLPYSILEEGRFECQGSGECCQNYVFGPLEDADIERLAQLDIAGAFPHLAGAPYLETLEREGAPFRSLATVDDRCVFLQDDRRCGLHARFGADAKPRLCRQYPTESFATIAGIKVYDKGTCATFARSARAGLPLLEDLPRVRALLPSRYNLYHPMVLLGDGIPLDYGHYLRFVDVAVALVKRRIGTAADTVRALCRGLTRMAGALAACPLGPGEPDATVAAALADPDAWYEGEPDPSSPAVRGGAFRIAELANDLLTAIGGTLGNAVTSGRGYMSHRLLREVAQPLHLLVHQAMRASGGPATMEYYESIAAVAVDDPEIDAVLRISLRQKLFGTRALVESRAFPALLRLGVVVLLTVWGARLRAAAEGRAAAHADDLSYGHMLASRLCEIASVEEQLIRYEVMAPVVLEALPAVARLRSSSPT